MKALIAAWLTPKGFRAGLNEAGHFGGRNVTIEVFLANGFKQRKNTAEHGSYDPASGHGDPNQHNNRAPDSTEGSYRSDSR
jgi:hypothetical protein